MTNPARLSIAAAGRAFRAGTLTPTDLAQAQLTLTDALNPLIHAFVAVSDDQAMNAAA